MSKYYNVASAAAMIFGLALLGGCQISQTGSSTYAGTGLASKSNKAKTLNRNIAGPVTNAVEEGVEFDNYTDSGTVLLKPAKKARIKKQIRKHKTKLRKSARLRQNNRKVIARTKSKRAAIRLKGNRIVSARTKARSKSRGGRSYDALIRRYASANGVPYTLARAVVQVESGFRPGARGKVGEIGLMQLRKNTARGMGYRGSTKGLYSPETNIKYGMRYLGKAYKLGGRSTCGAILKYNAGHGAKRMNPVSRRYCNKVQRIIRGKV